MEPLPRYPQVVVETTPDESDAMVGRLTMLGAEGIEERDATTLVKGGVHGVTLVASFATRDEADRAAHEIGPAARVEEILGDAWRDAWREHWRPTRIGSRIVVVPSWVNYTQQHDDLVMRLDPGRAFGTGQHASTALAVECLERHLEAHPGGRMIDVGCGSGILAFAALLLGAERAIACDTDEEAVHSAEENAEALGLAPRVEFRTGGAEVVPEQAPLVVANIEAAVLTPLAGALAGRVEPGGSIILSGILADQGDRVRGAYEACGLRLHDSPSRDGWVALWLER